MFTCVGAIWNAESKVKIKCFEQSVLKKMALDHSKIVDRF